jgi:CBS domain-containing protein
VKVRDVMTKAVETCGPDTNLASVVETMWTRDIGMVPVVGERGEAIGVLTDRDICIALGTRDAQASAMVARVAMIAPVVGCSPDDDCFEALLLMERSRVRRLPVLGPHGVVLGILSLDDVVARAAHSPSGDPLRSAVVEVLSAIGGHKNTWLVPVVA